MLSEERRELIVREVRDSGFVHASELSARIQVSRATIWRDIGRLARAGLVSKVRGGAAAAAEGAFGVATATATMPPGLTIGIQVPTADYYFRSVIEGAREVCEAVGARLTVGVSGYRGRGDDSEAIRGLINAGADGLLLSPGQYRSSGIPRGFLAELGRPGVLIDRELAGLAGPDWAAVSTARDAGVYAAVEHLIQLGHERIGMVLPEARNHLTEHLLRGYGAAVLDHLEPVENPDEPWIFDRELPTSELLEQFRERAVTGVICFNDVSAVAMAHEAVGEGWRIPDDLSIVSYDDELAADASPPLTAISPPRSTLGQEAARRLLDHLSGQQPLAGRRLGIEPRLVVRESTGAPATRQQSRTK